MTSGEDFYRNFYRTGRNRSVVHNTEQHPDSRKPRSSGMKQTSADADERLESKFKSPLAHHSVPDLPPFSGKGDHYAGRGLGGP
jgi:hypothetical protein